MIHFWVVNLQMPVHGHHHLVAVVALLLLHLLALVPVGDVQVEVEHVVCSVVTKLAVLVLDLQMDGVDVLVHSHLVGEHLRAGRTVVAPMAKARRSVTEVIVIATPACFMVVPKLSARDLSRFSGVERLSKA